MATLPDGAYAVDPTHSNVGFEVKHMGIATVRGAFKTFNGTIEASGGALTLKGDVALDSIDTGDANRDGHLKSPEFFDAEQFPQIAFSSASSQIDGDAITLNGDITIKGTTKPITLTGAALEGGEDPWGNQRVGFEVGGSIDRKDFGLTWNQVLPNGNALIGDDVKLVVSVSAVKAA